MMKPLRLCLAIPAAALGAIVGPLLAASVYTTIGLEHTANWLVDTITRLTDTEDDKPDWWPLDLFHRMGK